MALTEKSRQNLLKLASYLESLPEDYDHFTMKNYFLNNQYQTTFPTKDELNMTTCGTVACAVGHGPAAGIELTGRYITKLLYRVRDGAILVRWSAYTIDNFLDGLDDSDIDRTFAFLFDTSWSEHDDHHWGAAARIYYFLDHLGTTGEEYQDYTKLGDVPLYQEYRKVA